MCAGPGEERAEFLTSTDPWFHAIALAHAPDGSVFIADFYREIIEDYSAIPRYLQQQYGLVDGKDRGRIWRLTHGDAPRAPAADMSRLGVEQLASASIGGGVHATGSAGFGPTTGGALLRIAEV